MNLISNKGQCNATNDDSELPKILTNIFCELTYTVIIFHTGIFCLSDS